jgi:hypothetical protein
MSILRLFLAKHRFFLCRLLAHYLMLVSKHLFVTPSFAQLLYLQPLPCPVLGCE